MRICVLTLLLIPHLALGVSEKEVVSSSMTHFPKILQSLQKIEEANARLSESRGAFDGKIKANLDTRSQGYYDGDFYKATIEKPLPFLNSKIYGGQRQGFGDFPVYEGKSETLSGGEVFAGVSLSLLRNALIDGVRYNIKYNKQEQEQAQMNLRLAQIDVQTMALKAYWTWVIKGHELKVFQNLLGLAKARARQIDRRIKLGDLARIYASENNQYIRKREAQVTQSQLEFQEANYYLSLFYRDSEGLPRLLSMENLPSLKQGVLASIVDYVSVYQLALKENINLKILNSKEQQANLDVRLGTNELLPKVDVNFEWNQDQGLGPNRLTQDENRILLNVEFPLQFRKGQGKRRAGKAKIAQLKTKKQWLEEKLKVYVQSLVVKLNSFAEIYKLTSDQSELASKLVRAERRKFTQGASDLVLVNIREENLAEAQVKNLLSLLKYHFVDADIRKVKVDFVVSQ